MIVNKEIKTFIRILKDVGLYSQWLKNRKKYCYRSHNKVFDLRSDYYTFSGFNGASFVWTESDNYPFWASLSSIMFNVKPSVMINDDNLIETIKQLINKKYI